MQTNSVPILLEFWTDQYCIKYDRKILLQKNSLSYLVGAIPIYLSRKFYQLSELLYSAVLPWVVQTMPSPNGCLLHFELLELLIVPITFSSATVYLSILSHSQAGLSYHYTRFFKIVPRYL